MERVHVVVVGGGRLPLVAAVAGRVRRSRLPAPPRRCEYVIDGLSFVGVHFLRKRKSSLLLGVREDAAIVADAVAARR